MKFSKKATLFALTLLASAQSLYAMDSATSTPERAEKGTRPLLQQGSMSSLPVFRPDTTYTGPGESFHLNVKNVIDTGRSLVDTTVAHGDRTAVAPTLKLVRKVVDALVAPLIEPNYDVVWDPDTNRKRNRADDGLVETRGLSTADVARITHNVDQIINKRSAPGIPGLTADRKIRDIHGLYAPADFGFYLGLIKAFYQGAGIEDLNILSLQVTVPRGTYDPRRRERTIQSTGTSAHTHFHIATPATGELDIESGNTAVLSFINQQLMANNRQTLPALTAFDSFRDLIGPGNLEAFPYGSISKPISLDAATRDAPTIIAFVENANRVLEQGRTLTANIERLLPPPAKRMSVTNRRGSGTYGSLSRKGSGISATDATEDSLSSGLDGVRTTGSLVFPAIHQTLRTQMNELKPLVIRALKKHETSITSDTHPLAHHVITNSDEAGQYNGTRQELTSHLQTKPTTFPNLMEEGDLAVLESLVTSLETLKTAPTAE